MTGHVDAPPRHHSNAHLGMAVRRPLVPSVSEALPIGVTTVPGSDRVQRVFDVVFSSCALIVIAVVTPIIAIAIAIDSPGPIFFRQERIGRHGEPFRILKFRSMNADAERALSGLASQNDGAGPLFKLRDDPRVTGVGRVLRRYSIDELPQFWNVLRGEMSIVGPRPALRHEVLAYDERVRGRLAVRPGITGPWQVSGRSDLAWDHAVDLDLDYAVHRSMVTDLILIRRTFRAILRPKGAY